MYICGTIKISLIISLIKNILILNNILMEYREMFDNLFDDFEFLFTIIWIEFAMEIKIIL